MRVFQCAFSAFVFLWVGCAASVWATTIVYTDLNSWQTAVKGSGYTSTNIDFDNATRTTSGGIDIVTAGEVNFAGTVVGIPFLVMENNIYGTGNILDFVENQRIQITMPSSTYAFGFNFGGSQQNGTSHGPSAWLNQVVLSTDETFGHYDGSYPNFAFFGVLSDNPIASLMFRTGSEFSDAIIDNFRYAQDPPIPAPEPASLFLLALGLISLGAIRRKYKE